MKTKGLIAVVILGIILTSIVGNAFQHFFNTSLETRKKENEQAERLANDKYLNDTTKPSLSLSNDKITIYQGDVINYKGQIREAWDNLEGDLTDQVKYNTIDVNETGNYEIEYTVKDKAGNKAIAILKVKVNPKVDFKKQ